jgi:hypothetical protein
MVLSDNKVIAPQPLPTFNVKRTCHAKDFKTDSDPSTETVRRALAELERRIEKQALTKIPTKRAYKQGSRTQPRTTEFNGGAPPSGLSNSASCADQSSSMWTNAGVHAHAPSRSKPDPASRCRRAMMVSMRVGAELGDGHECRGCWRLQEATFENGLEEIVTHEDPRGRFIVITDVRGGTERYAIGDPMTKAYL